MNCRKREVLGSRNELTLDKLRTRVLDVLKEWLTYMEKPQRDSLQKDVLKWVHARESLSLHHKAELKEIFETADNDDDAASSVTLLPRYSVHNAQSGRPPSPAPTCHSPRPPSPAPTYTTLDPQEPQLAVRSPQNPLRSEETTPGVRREGWNLLDISASLLAMAITSQQMDLFRRLKLRDCLKVAGALPNTGEQNSFRDVLAYLTKVASQCDNIEFSWGSGSSTQS